jgi:hypothetical protein
MYSVLEQYIPLCGFYTVSNSFPWGTLLLLYFDNGCFVGDVITHGDTTKCANADATVREGFTDERERVLTIGFHGQQAAPPVTDVELMSSSIDWCSMSPMSARLYHLPDYRCMPGSLPKAFSPKPNQNVCHRCFDYQQRLVPRWLKQEHFVSLEFSSNSRHEWAECIGYDKLLDELHLWRQHTSPDKSRIQTMLNR